MAVELAVLDRLERGGQERGHLLRCDDDAILAVDRKNAADEQRFEPQHRHVTAGAVAQALEALGTCDDAQQLGVARLVREARRPQRNVEARAGHAVGAGALGPLGAPVMQALQLLLQLRRRQCQSRVQLERRREHLCRQRPAAAFELPGHQAIQIQNVEDAGQRGDPQAEEHDALQTNSSTAGGRRL